MNSLYPMTLLYDAECPVCSLEMDHLRQRDSAGRLRFVDIAAPGFDAAAWGTTYAALDAELHAVGADGQVLIGVPALRAAYAAVGLGWVFAPSAWGPLSPLADAGYRVFARHRREISRVAAPLIDALRTWRARRVSAQMARCQAGACRLHEDGSTQ